MSGIKCPNCGKELKYEKPVGLTRYSYFCESCKKIYELDLRGNMKEMNDIFNGIFGGIFND
jgi:DNA-directed RNA polymerase subunit RPC12/RpoP